MAHENEYIRFDWAMKYILRDKANFEILEGLVSVLLNDSIKIEEILESEANQDDDRDKFNRVDIKAKNSRGDIIIVEVQLTTQLHYLERILYGTSKAITEHMSLGDDYGKVRKVYSISILYCDFGKGADYVYHGRTSFIGLHTHDELLVSKRQRGVIEHQLPHEIFPEYYILRVNSFEKIQDTPLDEWMQYLKEGKIKEETETPGLQRARAKLNYLNMSKDERRAYERYAENIAYQNDVIANARVEGQSEGFVKGTKHGHAKGRAEGLAEGRAEGLAEGRAEGIAEEKRKNALALLQLGVDKEVISKATGLSAEEINKL